MKRQSTTLSSLVSVDRTADPRLFYPKPYRQPVGVRTQEPDEMEGLEVFKDGLSFRSSYPLPTGKRVELTLCQGNLVVNAVVVLSQPLSDDHGGYSIRTRYTDASPDVHDLISEECQGGLVQTCTGEIA